ncbi:hypothetical protein Rsub_04592 [Raphidocelis subcapitata]|uniref:C2HC/C3H-type domain-containing protein n=1 Tax=Raphidocelis subcapitata TaxID=307507 RepID=A0A2V0NXX9_9CHLO|nr:hypothetical protein Rsub_04592 [Raphidocelis subcapitata]|eukprot:GBF92488.1 hypothetical protein Rsub_04592 [Raphidocelis subcapitata]
MAFSSQARARAPYSPARYAAGALLHGAARPEQEQASLWGPPERGVRVVPGAMPAQQRRSQGPSEGGEGATAAAVGRVKAMLAGWPRRGASGSGGGAAGTSGGGGGAAASSGGLASHMIWTAGPAEDEETDLDYGIGGEQAVAPASPSRGLQWRFGGGADGGGSSGGGSSGGGASGGGASGGGRVGGYQAQHSAAQQYKQQHQQQHYQPAAGSAAALASAAAFAAADPPASPYAAGRAAARIAAGTAAFAPVTPSAAAGALPPSDRRARVAITPSGYPADELLPAHLPAHRMSQSEALASPAGNGFGTGGGAAPWEGGSSGGGGGRDSARRAAAPLQWSLPQASAPAPRGASPMRPRGSGGGPGERATAPPPAYAPRGGHGQSASPLPQQPRGGLDWGVPAPPPRGSSASSGDGSTGGIGGGLWGDSAGGAAPPIAAGPRPPSSQRLEGLGRLKQLSTQRLATRIGTPPSADAAAAMLSDGGLGSAAGGGGRAGGGVARAAEVGRSSAPGRASAAAAPDPAAARRRPSGLSGLAPAQQPPAGQRRSDPAAAAAPSQRQQQRQPPPPPPPPPPQQQQQQPRPRAQEPEPALGPEAFPSESAEGPDRIECATCGRRFAAPALERHARICAKVFCSKRPAFDSAGARAVEGGIAAPPPPPPASRRAAAAKGGAGRGGGGGGAGGKEGVGKAKWSKQSEQLRAAMRAARGDGGGAEAGGGGGFDEPEEDDRVPCPHCGRRFAPLTADRHIPKCQSISAKPSTLRARGGRAAHMRTNVPAPPQRGRF